MIPRRVSMVAPAGNMPVAPLALAAPEEVAAPDPVAEAAARQLRLMEQNMTAQLSVQGPAPVMQGNPAQSGLAGQQAPMGTGNQDLSPGALLTQLSQLKTVSANDRIANVPACDILIKRGLAVRSGGFTLLSEKGLNYLIDFGLL